MKIKILLLSVIFLQGCSQQQTVSEFVKGCISGTMFTFQGITHTPWQDEYNAGAYQMCLRMEKQYGEDN